MRCRSTKVAHTVAQGTIRCAGIKVAVNTANRSNLTDKELLEIYPTLTDKELAVPYQLPVPDQ
jgi:hypothetical protein